MPHTAAFHDPAQAQLCKDSFKSFKFTHCQLDRKVNFQESNIVQVSATDELSN